MPNIYTRSGGSTLVVPEEDAVAFDEDPNEVEFEADPENIDDDEESPSRLMMDKIDDVKEDLGSQLYVDLCNITSDFSRVERRASRMEKWIMNNVGSQCSALFPSTSGDDLEVEDDLDGEEVDMHSASDIRSNPDAQSVPSTYDCAVSNNSTVSLEIERECDNERQSDKMARKAMSGYYVKYRDEYYCVPVLAVKHYKNMPFEVNTIHEMILLTTRGERAITWNKYVSNGLLKPHHIVVLKMKSRHGMLGDATTRAGNKNDYFWGVVIKQKPQNEQACTAAVSASADDHKIIHLLPEPIVYKLHKKFLTDPNVDCTSLLPALAPDLIHNEVWSPKNPTRNVPIPGKSRKTTFDQVGNYWQPVPASKKLKSAMDEILCVCQKDDIEEE